MAAPERARLLVQTSTASQKRNHRSLRGGPSLRVLLMGAALSTCLACNARGNDGRMPAPTPAATSASLSAQAPQPSAHSSIPQTASARPGPSTAPSATPATLSPSATPSGASRKSGIAVTLGPADATFSSSLHGTISAVIANQSAATIVLDMCTLGSPILSLEFHNAAGQRVRTIPPGMPPTKAERAKCQFSLNAGATKTVSYGFHIFSPSLPAGRYTVRSSAMPSNTISFTIRGR